ncbi:hypothetical protein ACK39B_08620 [Aeromonas veronii]
MNSTTYSSQLNLEKMSTVWSSGQTRTLVKALIVTTVVTNPISFISTPSSGHPQVEAHKAVVASESDLQMTSVSAAEPSESTDEMEADMTTFLTVKDRVQDNYSSLKLSSTLAFFVMVLCGAFLAFVSSSLVSLMVVVPALIGSFGVVVANGIQLNQFKQNYDEYL